MTSQIPSQIQFVLDMLNWIERGNNQKTIAKLANRSKQAISYHIGRFKAKGLIEEVQNHPFSEYKLTPLGRQVKDNIGQSDGALDGYFRVHALILGWKIEDYGIWKFNDNFLKEMKGWKYQELVINKHKIHINTRGTLKVYCPEMYGKHPAETTDKIIEEAQKVVTYLQSKYSLSLGERYRIRDEHKELVGSNKIAELFGHLKLGGVWIDASTGKRELEEGHDSNRLEKLLDVPDVLDKMLVPALEKLTAQLELHLSVEAKQEQNQIKMNQTLEEIRDALRRMGK